MTNDIYKSSSYHSLEIQSKNLKSKKNSFILQRQGTKVKKYNRIRIFMIQGVRAYVVVHSFSHWL